MNRVEEDLLEVQLWYAMFISTKPREDMKGYSRAREDYRERLVFKYTKNIMKEFVLITTQDCTKCKFLKPHVEKWCKENGYSFKEMEYWPWMEEVTSVPCAMIWEDIILDYDWIIELITNKNKFY